jgi:hypothetical protein
MFLNLRESLTVLTPSTWPSITADTHNRTDSIQLTTLETRWAVQSTAQSHTEENDDDDDERAGDA